MRRNEVNWDFSGFSTLGVVRGWAGVLWENGVKQESVCLRLVKEIPTFLILNLNFMKKKDRGLKERIITRLECQESFFKYLINSCSNRKTV